MVKERRRGRGGEGEGEQRGGKGLGTWAKEEECMRAEERRNE